MNNIEKIQRTQRMGLVIVSVMLVVIVPIVVYRLFFVGAGNDYYDTGMAQFYNKEYAASATEFQLDVKQDPKHTLGYYYLGRSLQEQGRYQEATLAFQQAYIMASASDHPDTAFAAKCQAYTDLCRDKAQPK